MRQLLMKTVIGVSPYSDGSGYAYTVTFSTNAPDEKPTIEIEGTATMVLAEDEWENLRAAIDNSLYRHKGTVVDLAKSEEARK